MPHFLSWTRRDVVKGAVMSGLAALAPGLPAEEERGAEFERVAFVATNWRGGEASGIRALHLDRERAATEIAFHVSDKPAAITLNRSRNRLYAANYVADTGFLPCGSIETFAISWEPFRMELIRRTALALGSLHPDGVALSPDGALLAVNCSSCGVLNVLPIDREGRASSPTAVHKRCRINLSISREVSADLVRFGGEKALMLRQHDGRVRLFSCSKDEIRECVRSGELMSTNRPLIDSEDVRTLESRQKQIEYDQPFVVTNIS